MTTAPFSIIVPAHNEAEVIARCLAGLTEGDAQREAQILVICNGCTDDTADRARAALPTATIIECPQGSKPDAINKGLDGAAHEIVLVVDADVITDRRSLEALVTALEEPGVMAVSPVPTLGLKGAEAWIHAYYRVWSVHSFFESGVGGSGIYGLSPAGLKTLGRMPPVISDDGYVRGLFPLGAQRRLSTDAEGVPLKNEVHPPRRVTDLVRCEARWRTGDGQVRDLLHVTAKRETPGKGFISLLKNPKVSKRDLTIYALIKLMGRAQLWRNRLRGSGTVWHRDQHSRAGVGA